MSFGDIEFSYGSPPRHVIVTRDALRVVASGDDIAQQSSEDIFCRHRDYFRRVAKDMIALGEAVEDEPIVITSSTLDPLPPSAQTLH